MDLDEFTEAYITAMLWSTTDESTPAGGEPLDNNYGPEDLAAETLANIIRDCAAFQAEAQTIWAGALRRPSGDGTGEDSQAGHDFWLTRAGHGAGFWDMDWEAGAGGKLTEISKRYGEVWVYVGDDGQIHGH